MAKLTRKLARKYKSLTTVSTQFAIGLPQQFQPWLAGNKHSVRRRGAGLSRAQQSVSKLMSNHKWKWPKQDIVFISDLHADAQALTDSLVACGSIKPVRNDESIKLTSVGKQRVHVFGGDFFDKGPSNLALLRQLKCFIEAGAKVKLLAGNHDIRVYYGMRYAGLTRDPRNGHFFVRMGVKAVPFLAEIKRDYLTESDYQRLPDDDGCARLLIPQHEWHQQFPKLAAWMMPPPAIEREVSKINNKSAKFRQACTEAGLSMRTAYAAALKWQQLFLQPEGEFHWFFEQLQLTYKRGSFLFVHAGLDDRMAAMLHDQGIGFANKLFKLQLSGSAFEFYYGPVANMIRTKYRSVDMPLSQHGANLAHAAGVHAIVHGHRNLLRGQRISSRKSLIHFECDITLDSHSRAKEGLTGAGAGATIIDAKGAVIGISNDYQWIKVFDPKGIRADYKQQALTA
ncbi:metallophosphoesterase [Neiella marina]|uniref:Metallophosphoesterase n=1 Tax=Neiella holothuriorum TaxID=2870530 RepID=A0ABS7ED39_9GAMM|nr:metallophosphoesterase [Neiella holothuriorum]MBW8190240.1 metallophosphoesterase [Neiella holothuriorum]